MPCTFIMWYERHPIYCRRNRSRSAAEAMGTSVNQLIQDYPRQLAGNADTNADAAELEKLSRMTRGNSRRWKFNREELHQRR